MQRLIPEHRIRLGAHADNWQDAIRDSAGLVEADGITGPEYVDAILDSFDRNGDYMIVVPEVVLAHARPEHGARGTGMSLLTLDEPVLYDADSGKTITAVFTLAAADEDQHLAVMQRLAELLIDDEALQTVLTSRDPKQIAAMLEDEG